MADPALDALHWALENHIDAAAPGAQTVFMQARWSTALRRLGEPLLVQSFKPWVDTLLGSGLTVLPELDAAAPRFHRALLLPGRQRTQARAQLARVALQCLPDAVVVAAQENKEGARSLEADMVDLFGAVNHESKFKSRVVWAGLRGLNRELAARWIQDDQPQTVTHTDVDGETISFLSRPGVFAWDRIDVGSALLAAQIPKDLKGRIADLGCGFGYLAAEVLRRNPRVTHLDCFEACHRALTLARENLPHFAAPGVHLDFRWHDVGLGLAEPGSGVRYDAVVCNPPFHTSRADNVALGLRFVNAAAAALRPDGRLLMVANLHLAYEAALATGFRSIRVLSQTQGFKMLEVRR